MKIMKENAIASVAAPVAPNPPDNARPDDFIQRLSYAGQSLTPIFNRVYRVGGDWLQSVNRLVAMAMVGALIAINNGIQCVSEYLYRKFIDSDECQTGSIHGKLMTRAAYIVDELAIPLETESERRQGIGGTLEQLVYRIGCAVHQLARFSPAGPISPAETEAKTLLVTDYASPGLQALFHLYDNRTGEGIYESAVLILAANIGARLGDRRACAEERRDIQSLKVLWDIVIAARYLSD
ncbi:hypothetical protein [Martelella alba]|uniref:Uncharacterized protein n=1 Tax=Martelella alba TaxID=2590451 RepID=A0ABY2SGZ7_9HYPH|nr:hypothetical protein [Martelella alba]TKI04471.1 hypothetical protein FCN80_17765 [Martelella alba]